MRAVKATGFGEPRSGRSIAASVRKGAAKKGTTDEADCFLRSGTGRKGAAGAATGNRTRGSLESGEPDQGDLRRQAGPRGPKVPETICSVPEGGGGRKDFPGRMRPECRRNAGEWRRGVARPDWAGRASGDRLPPCPEFTRPALNDACLLRRNDRGAARAPGSAGQRIPASGPVHP